MKEKLKANKLLYVLLGIPVFLFTSLFFLICFPIFVLTTVCSLAVTGSRLLFTIIKGDGEREAHAEESVNL